MGCLSTSTIQDNSIGCDSDYPDGLKNVKIHDPQDGMAVNLDQGAVRSCTRYALAACLYEQVHGVMRFFCVETVNLSQQNIANNLE